MIRPLVPMLTAALLLGGTAGCSDEEPSHTMGRDAGVDGGTVQADAAANMRDMADTEAPPDVGRPNTTGCEAAADPNGLCFERLGVMGSFCEQGTGRCLVDPAMMQAGPHEVIQIFDTSAHPEACESSTANGAPRPGLGHRLGGAPRRRRCAPGLGRGARAGAGETPNQRLQLLCLHGRRAPGHSPRRRRPTHLPGRRRRRDLPRRQRRQPRLRGLAAGGLRRRRPAPPSRCGPATRSSCPNTPTAASAPPATTTAATCTPSYLCGSRVQVGPGGDDRGCVLRLGEGNRRGYSVVTVPAPL